MDRRGTLLQTPLSSLAEWKKLCCKQKGAGQASSHKPAPAQLISVIIPAYNEEGYLDRTLQSLRRQNYSWFEIIVVANGCSDRTVEIARKYCDRVIVLSQKSLGISRNLGARMARGELLLFLDADTTLEPMALRVIANEFPLAAAAGTLRGAPSRRRRQYQWVYSLKNFVHRWSLHRGSSGTILCWKKHFIRAGGFDEGLEVRENSELIRRLRSFGTYRYIPDVTATTSMRRYDRRGFYCVLWLWFKLWVQSLFSDLHQRHYEAVR